MTSRLIIRMTAVSLVLLTLIFFVTEPQARRFGGGGISKGGVAAGGGFSGRGFSGAGRGISRDVGRRVDRDIDRRASRDPGERSDNLRDRQEDRQDFVEERQDQRQDFVEDELDDWDRCCFDDGGEFLAGAVIGGAIGAAAASDNTTYIVTLPCTTTAVLYEGYSYYNCSGTWYQKSYAGGDVVYIVTSPPPGY